MYDRELVLEVLSQIYQSTQKISRRCEPIESAVDFTRSDAGMEKLDAVCMQLIVIGESLKNLDKITSHSLLSGYPQVEWKKAMGLRDIISHHYFDTNAEAIFEVCKIHVPALAEIIIKIEADVRSTG
jgi:uncharacterized protein with HEPN domain